jgi:hypothetical protein
MMTGRGGAEGKSRLIGRAEWIGLVFFVGVGLLALPFVRDVFLVQGIWLTICSAIGITG